jgi:hypothetical protein
MHLRRGPLLFVYLEYEFTAQGRLPCPFRAGRFSPTRRSVRVWTTVLLETVPQHSNFVPSDRFHQWQDCL